MELTFSETSLPSATSLAGGGEEPSILSDPRSLLTVLHIDDDPAFCHLAERTLEEYAKVEFLHSVPEAGQLKLDGYDLVLLDYKLPVRDGLEILDEIRGCSRDIPVLFLTGYGSPNLAAEALSRGATSFLTKPVAPSLLREQILSLVERMGKRRGQNDRNGVSPVHGTGVSALPMVETRAKQFRARTAEEHLLEGKVLRFGYRSIHVELPRSRRMDRGQVLRGIEFCFGDQVLECGAGFIGGLSKNSSDTVEVEVILNGVWALSVVERRPGSGFPEEPGLSPLAEYRKGVLSDWDRLSPEFRLAVFELSEVLDALQCACQIHRSKERGEISIVDFEGETELVKRLSREYGALFWKAVQRFESASKAIISAEDRKLGKEYARRILYPFTLASPFLSRVVERPIDVPGDFGMLGQILGNPLEGHEIYDRIVNSWILSCGAASAYRYRVELLHREIVEVVARANREGRKAEVLSMASGVAYEVQRFIENPPASHRVSFSLVDFSETTLQEARRQFDLLGDLPEEIGLSLFQSSVIDLANQSRGVGAQPVAGFQPRSDYDIVYCAGLFDYLSDRLIVKVTTYLFDRLRDGGKLVLSNFTTENPILAWMTYVMDWELIYRTEGEFEALMRRAVGTSAELRKETDADGVEVYAIIRKI